MNLGIMHKVIKVSPVSGYLLALTFEDETEKIVDIGHFVRKGISAPLADQDYFRQVAIDSAGGIYWPNGYDFCPNYLYEEVPATDLLLA